MPLEVYWHDSEESILVYKLVSPWTLEDMYRVVDEGYAMSWQKEGELFLIYDLRENENFPNGFLKALNYMQKRYQENVVLRVVVGGNAIFRTIYNVVRRLDARLTERFVMVDTIDEAHQCICMYRKTPSP